MRQAPERIDLEIIASLVAESSRVLDVGSGDGDLLALLEEKRNVRGCGIELSQEGVSRGVARGLNVIKGDAETELQNYPDGAFDYVILSQTIQAMHKPAEGIGQMLRIGKRAIVSFPNFGFWRIRFYLFFYGQMPVSSLLPYRWYDTPNLHLCTIEDFLGLVKDSNITTSHFLALSATRQRKWLRPNALANWLAQQAIFVLESKKEEN
jgi:methionine biosynthesis protein MetW